MKILRKGKIKVETHKFKCEHCGTKFLAEKPEYTEKTLFERNEFIKKFTSTCPVCGKEIIEFVSE